MGIEFLLLNLFVSAAPVSYSRQVLPVLKAQCLSCHSGANPASGYSMETRELLLKGGRHGAAIVVGKGAQSALVRYLTGENRPKMPPDGALDLDKIALLRRWIDEGAKVDANTIPQTTLSPNTQTSEHLNSPNTQLPAPVTALAYSPDGRTLAVGGYRAVRLLDPATGQLLRIVAGAADQVQAVAWSVDGKLLAAAGGTPGVMGEVILYDTETWRPLRTLSGHTEVVYAAAFRPNGRELATGSLDKTARIWNVDTGQCLRIIKDHADAVMGVAYSPDGKLLATGSTDRSVKLFDTATWKRVAVLNAHEDGVTRVAFNAAGTLLATASADKTVRVWAVKIGAMENPQHTLGEGDAINACTFSPDGSLLVYGACNRVVKICKGDGSGQSAELKDLSDWVYSVAVGKDNQTVVAGTQDGKVLFYDVRQNRLIRTITVAPAASTGR
jgi:WD40 repeat protein